MLPEFFYETSSLYFLKLFQVFFRFDMKYLQMVKLENVFATTVYLYNNQYLNKAIRNRQTSTF